MTVKLLLLLIVSPLGLLAQPEPVKLPLVLPDHYSYAIPKPMYPVNQAFYPVNSFGFPPDTIDAANYVGYIYPNPDHIPGSTCINRNPEDFHAPMPGDLTIAIYPNDTTEMEELEFGDTMTFFYTFPVIVANQSFDTLVIGTSRVPTSFGYYNLVDLILEGKDDNGQWRHLETPAAISGTSNALVLPGRQIAITSGYLYEGAFETDLRLRLGDAVSETYRGWVNPAAFR